MLIGYQWGAEIAFDIFRYDRVFYWRLCLRRRCFIAANKQKLCKTNTYNLKHRHIQIIQYLERRTNTSTDTNTGNQTHSQTDERINNLTNTQSDSQTEKQANRYKKTHTHTLTAVNTNTQTNTQTSKTFIGSMLNW